MTTAPGCYRAKEKLNSIVLRPRQNELAPIKEVPASSATFFESFGVELQPDFEFVPADGDGIPDDKNPFAFKLKPEINTGGSTVFDREAPHSVQL